MIPVADSRNFNLQLLRLFVLLAVFPGLVENLKATRGMSEDAADSTLHRVIGKLSEVASESARRRPATRAAAGGGRRRFVTHTRGGRGKVAVRRRVSRLFGSK